MTKRANFVILDDFPGDQLSIIDFEGNKAGFVNGRPVMYDAAGSVIKNYQRISTFDFDIVIADGNTSVKLSGHLV